MRELAIAAVGLALGGFVLRQRSRLPPLSGRTASEALADTTDTALSRAVAPLLAMHPGLSGIYALTDGYDAFSARMLLANAAERSLDVQYYIWDKDLTGTLLFDALRRAADRGVRVRLLLDDNNTAGLDSVLAALDAHERIEVRLFNPFVFRKRRLLGYVTDFRRLNRRMHNKSFTADDQVTVVGGRNIADHYFSTGAHRPFIDLDVLAIGTAVNAVSVDFDRYWASRSAYPVRTLFPPANRADIAALEAAAAAVMNDAKAQEYLEAVRNRAFVTDLVAHRLQLDWANVRLLSDDPAKGLDQARPGGLLVDQFREALGDPARELMLVSSYFVPSSSFITRLGELAASGVEIDVVTNALNATDVKVVNAGYGGKRARLLGAGVRLFEIRGSVPGNSPAKRGVSRSRGSLGSGGSTLHAKTFVIDRTRIFIGSFNLDPRSERLNTEQGFVIDSPALAARVAERVEEALPHVAYEVLLSPSGHLYWLETRDGRTTRHDTEPGTDLFERIAIRLLSRLPIAWLL